ncbi:cell division-specific peptidoglycan biosynthesis regulator FtsW [Brevibacterium siliguriense]|uniref:Probable peptidoglycan glycosyltransferase FtsW n=1 Tax=Brevibacterium siliguriense TaxID=1136497 RepID=A0A1H1T729_9MICO|nr:putative lipid II flippase FtsW [Brevibacterium siliguriense]SDS55953.1 cell division-specific peptidoglycan biosynthesis regulator FtsW [Brevibacterium siliguriense]
MGRQTTAKADERRRRKLAKTTVSASAPTRTRDAGTTAATKRSGVKPAPKAPAAKSRTTGSASKSASVKKVAANSTGVKKPVRKPAKAAGKSPEKTASVIRKAWKHLRSDIAGLSAHPLTTYFLILVCVVLLTGLGLVMVLSASSITSYDGGAGSSFAYFNKQAMYAGVGLVLMFAASRMPLQFWKRIAWFAILGGLFMQALVFAPGLGKETKGNANWIGFGGFQIQPSEFLKVALALWLGFMLAQKAGKMTTFGHAMIPIVPGILAAAGLVVAGNDLGTGLVIMAVAVVCLFVGGFPMKYFLLLGSVLAAAVVFFVLSSQNRLDRIQAMLTGHADQTSADTMGQAWQSNHGLFSLASGGWLGVGLGASREKWSWLPEAHNDFIFAIIGEELGLVGSLVVILIFAVLGYGMVRVVMRSNSLMVQVATAGFFALIVGQAGINIGVVTGLLPVIGLPLPFVSYGGSSIIASLLAVGVVLSFARTEPGAEAAIAANKDRLRSSLAVLARKKRK